VNGAYVMSKDKRSTKYEVDLESLEVNNLKIVA